MTRISHLMWMLMTSTSSLVTHCMIRPIHELRFFRKDRQGLTAARVLQEVTGRQVLQDRLVHEGLLVAVCKVLQEVMDRLVHEDRQGLPYEVRKVLQVLQDLKGQILQLLVLRDPKVQVVLLVREVLEARTEVMALMVRTAHEVHKVQVVLLVREVLRVRLDPKALLVVLVLRDPEVRLDLEALLVVLVLKVLKVLLVLRDLKVLLVLRALLVHQAPAQLTPQFGLVSRLLPSSQITCGGHQATLNCSGCVVVLRSRTYQSVTPMPCGSLIRLVILHMVKTM